jgi:hypothetical protein
MLTRIVVSGLAGAVVILVLAGVLFGVVFADFFASATPEFAGVARASTQYGLIAVADLVYAGLLAFILSSLAGRNTFGRGALYGLVIGSAAVLHFDLLSAATTHLTTPATVAVNVMLSAFMSAVGGGVIGMVQGRLERR